MTLIEFLLDDSWQPTRIMEFFFFFFFLVFLDVAELIETS